jgi:ABC-type amino acid transport substrate-binding protein
MEAVQAKGTISAGVSFDVPGMGYTNPPTGQIEGFEVDLVRAIARNLLSALDGADFIQVVDAPHRGPAGKPGGHGGVANDDHA